MCDYIDSLPIDLQRELYCYFTYKELYDMAVDKRIRHLIYDRRFLYHKGSYKCQNLYSYREKYYSIYDRYFIKIIEDMILDYLEEIGNNKQNSSSENKVYVLINENHYAIYPETYFQAANKYLALHDIILFLKDNPGIERHTSHFLTDILSDKHFLLPTDQLVKKLLRKLKHPHRIHAWPNVYCSISVSGF